MIQPQELRLGNYVYDRGEKVIRIDFFEHLENGYDCKFGQNGELLPDGAPAHPLTEYTDSAKPIPLTEEWLLKFGFEKNMLTSLHLSFIWYGPDNLAIKGMLGSVKPYNIKYVHQLQNLYFALTGKELEVKP